MMVYLAGPIDDVDKPQADGWRDSLAVLLAERDLVSFFPNRAYVVSNRPSKEEMEAVVNCNRHAIACSVATIAYLGGPGRGIGTIREIEFSRHMSKPVIVISDGGLDRHFALSDCMIVDTILQAAERASTIARALRAEFSEADPA